MNSEEIKFLRWVAEFVMRDIQHKADRASVAKQLELIAAAEEARNVETERFKAVVERAK